ncbi:MAG: hypothetical protein AB7V57_20590 [Verrucomicrobiales bacterium]
MAISLLLACFAGVGLKKTETAARSFSAYEAYPEGWADKVKGIDDPALLRKLLLESMITERRFDQIIVQGSSMLAGLHYIVLALAAAHVLWGMLWLLKTRRKKPATVQSTVMEPMGGAQAA